MEEDEEEHMLKLLQKCYDDRALLKTTTNELYLSFENVRESVKNDLTSTSKTDENVD